MVLVRHLCEEADVQYITDNEGLYKAFNAGPVMAYKTNNADLYAEIFESTVKEAIRLSVRWIPSHPDVEKPLPPDVSLMDVKGNTQADRLAGIAAKRFALPLHVSAPVLYHKSLIKRIQHRLTTILVSLPSREKDKNTPPPQGPQAFPRCTVTFHLSHHFLQGS